MLTDKGSEMGGHLQEIAAGKRLSIVWTLSKCQRLFVFCTHSIPLTNLEKRSNSRKQSPCIIWNHPMWLTVLQWHHRVSKMFAPRKHINLRKEIDKPQDCQISFVQTLAFAFLDMKQFTSGVCSHWGTRSCNMITAPGCTYVTPETQTSSDIKLLLHQELACPPIIITSQITQASLIMSRNISWSSNLAGNCFRSKWWQWQSNMKSWNQSWIEKV